MDLVRNIPIHRLPTVFSISISILDLNLNFVNFKYTHATKTSFFSVYSWISAKTFTTSITVSFSSIFRGQHNYVFLSVSMLWREDRACKTLKVCKFYNFIQTRVWQRKFNEKDFSWLEVSTYPKIDATTTTFSTTWGRKVQEAIRSEHISYLIYGHSNAFPLT